MDDKVSPSATVTVTLPETCYETTGDDVLVNDYVEQEESSIMFKILQCGCWSKKCFKREESQLKDALSSDNPWIQHFTNGSRKRLSSTSSSLQYHVSDSQLHQDTGCSNTGTFEF
ncbi:hypothetical protein R6Q57_000687 [Mikania cordata]